jgi:hypothetical protein
MDKGILFDFINQMIGEAIEDINRKKYKGYTIYFHNFHKFDGTLLLTHLAKLGVCDPQIHKGRIISVKFHPFDHSGISKYGVTFFDSLLLLPASLEDLCKSFDIPDGKGIFPFNLYDVNYSGFVPDYNYFDQNKVSLFQYNAYKSSFGSKL